MELSFNKGNYDQHMNMVKATKELLNESIVLRSIKENVDNRISHSREENSSDKELTLILILALPLLITLIYINIQFGLTWRLIPAVGLFVFFLVYYNLIKDDSPDLQLTSPGLHEDDNPKPLKFLEMKVNYLLSLSGQQKIKLDLLHAFYILFFPFLTYFLYEIIIKSTPFDNIIIGLLVAFLICGVAWHFFFKNDFKALGYSQNQLRDYKKLIHQHYISYSSSEEE